LGSRGALKPHLRGVRHFDYPVTHQNFVENSRAVSCHEWQENDHVGADACVPIDMGSCRMPSAPSRLSWEGRSTIRELAPLARLQTDELTIDEPPARDHRRSADRSFCCDVSRHDRSVGSAIDAFGGLIHGVSVFLYITIIQSYCYSEPAVTKTKRCLQLQELGFSQQIQRHLLKPTDQVVIQSCVMLSVTIGIVI
jgi:hypothetical protein